MPPRLIIAYALIGLLVVFAFAVTIWLVRRRKLKQRILRGYRPPDWR